MTDSITIVGNIASDPRKTTTASGIDVTSFRVASEQRRFDKSTEKWIDGEPNWFTVTAYRALAVNAGASLHKGDRVIVRGRLRLRAWVDGERKGTAVEIDAEALGPELRWGTTVFSRSHAPAESDVIQLSAEPETGDVVQTEWAPDDADAEATPF